MLASLLINILYRTGLIHSKKKHNPKIIRAKKLPKMLFLDIFPSKKSSSILIYNLTRTKNLNNSPNQTIFRIILAIAIVFTLFLWDTIDKVNPNLLSIKFFKNYKHFLKIISNTSIKITLGQMMGTILQQQIYSPVAFIFSKWHLQSWWGKKVELA